MKLSIKLSLFCGLCALLSFGTVSAQTVASDSANYSNVFISYSSPADVAALANYANSQKLGGYIVWPLQGDTDPADTATQNSSLLYSLHSNATGNPVVMSYWMNWGVYTQHALPISAYPIPGSKNSDGSIATNPDFTHKLNYINTLVYAFLEVQAKLDPQSQPNKTPDDIGTLYFNDPWADLNPTDSFCNNNNICSYTSDQKGASFASSAMMGNFEAFANLSGVDTVISVGGYGHDNSFEDTFGNTHYVSNFVKSASDILTNYKLSGIDLDYENPNMTHAQSQQFLQLVEALSAGLPAGKYITVTILANPQYINGSENNNTVGFDSNVLKTIASLPNVKMINLMTYDFHGAFDYSADGSGKTGFLSNLFMPNDVPKGYDAKFSIDTSVQALKQFVPADKIGVGIPAYGRALANVDSKNGGLFSALTNTTLIPAGDLDPQNCSQTVPLNGNSCSGSFSYNYIVNHMIQSGGAFVATEHFDDASSAANGSTAFAATFTPGGTTPDYDLEITNTGSSTDPGIIVTVTQGSIGFTSDWLAPVNGDKTYNNSTNPSATSIEGLTGLTASWKTYTGGPSGTCPGTFDFTSDTHIMVNGATGVCSIAHW